MRYCRGVDRLDPELVRSCYHPDATDSHGTFSGAIDQYLEWVWRVLQRYSSTMHFLGNVLIEFDLESPDRARSESYGIAFHRTDGGAPKDNLVTGFRFIDDFERRARAAAGADQWRILRRVATTEWVSIDRPEDWWPISEAMPTGRRDRSDPVYLPRS
jgi:hypothetical protein